MQGAGYVMDMTHFGWRSCFGLWETSVSVATAGVKLFKHSSSPTGIYFIFFINWMQTTNSLVPYFFSARFKNFNMNKCHKAWKTFSFFAFRHTLHSSSVCFAHMFTLKTMGLFSCSAGWNNCTISITGTLRLAIVPVHCMKRDRLTHSASPLWSTIRGYNERAASLPARRRLSGSRETRFAHTIQTFPDWISYWQSECVHSQDRRGRIWAWCFKKPIILSAQPFSSHGEHEA